MELAKITTRRVRKAIPPIPCLAYASGPYSSKNGGVQLRTASLLFRARLWQAWPRCRASRSQFDRRSENRRGNDRPARDYSGILASDASTTRCVGRKGGRQRATRPGTAASLSYQSGDQDSSCSAQRDDEVPVMRSLLRLLCALDASRFCQAREPTMHLPTPHCSHLETDPEWLAYAVQFHAHLGPDTFIAPERSARKDLSDARCHGLLDP